MARGPVFRSASATVIGSVPIAGLPHPRHIQQRLAWAHHQTPVAASKRNIPQRKNPRTWNQPWQQRSHLACGRGAASGIRAKTFGQPPRDPWTKKRLAVEAPALKGKRLTAQPMATDWL